MALLQVRCSDTLAALFAGVAERAGLKVPAMMRKLMEIAIDQAGVTKPPASVPDEPRTTKRVHVRFSGVEMQAINKAAEGFSSVPAWIVSVVRAAIYKDVPHFRPAELEALAASNRELWAIGRNLNQVAHALNIDHQQPRQAAISEAHGRAIERALVAVDQHTRTVAALVRAARKRGWHE